MYEFRFDVAIDIIPNLLKGLQTTGVITGTGVGLGLSLGVLVAVLRLSKNFVVSKLAGAYIEFFRCTPVLVQLIWFVFVLPLLLQREIPTIIGVILAITLNGSAFFGEQIRAGIQSVPEELLDAATALGLSKIQRFRYIVLPQAIRIVIPLLITTSVGLLKDSALASTVGVADLMYQGQILTSIFYRPVEILTTVAAIYFSIAFPASVLVRVLERRLQVKISR